ncbi:MULTISPECIES: alkyl/aryl-sulfatase [Thalassolituus]|jgi:alkyl sulfatase BDS1-like metallo-beta-lactamase superfamily hydrolase|uniref:alkyl/aryl-sulfatase n=2 Tax=Oceanospirillaceae TaxID=135620 RepID=UPI0007CFBFCD|nr:MULTISPECIES: alkyl sulfatase dimerization domain-containing protein [Thalassolituus]KZY99666.1 alkyl sulfatase [Oleibacter sp. HI0075]MAX87251.1 alkyl/aryl-sulfatase [Oceanospirillaceae bacterium]MEC7545387.1 alkyl sulfatase dimerization domain-containing protein [Pseudomonadota bacterium]HCG78879.1 alkyl/aryl-sulfatase [Oceanospirillales bacterium]MBN56380.1 alkyl/aryl-sulfatase [Oceanospirillaceae bacterium]|tara:strand:+ start:2134 stop:4155 length:2022 start_codon:yes stop_codon:yes gene_type:complete
MFRIALLALSAALLAACDNSVEFESDANTLGHSAPTPTTVKANQAVLAQRPFSNTEDFELARKGLIASEDHLEIAHLTGKSLVWNMDEYGFVDANGENAPGSVNPSLWRQAALNNIHGLFKVTDGVYQIRGFDLANMTIIESESGWILVDPLTARETAHKALTFAQQHLGKYPIKAILFTHSHIDHFGGIQGILQNLSDEEKQSLTIVAPAGFEEEATSENIIAGTAMSRRAMYMYGKRLAREERGHVGTGLGKGPAFGSFGFEEATVHISEPITELSIDGVPFVFQTVSGSEAPAEFTFYLPKQKAFCGAEMLSRNMHNLYTLRGAKVRDANIWSRYIDEARVRFNQADVYFGSHHWPLWGQEKINHFLEQQRDTYKFIHDQSVRLLNKGYTPNEIAESLTLPEALNTQFHNQGYYGTLKHNAKAVYQAYLGWYNANPAKLDPLPEKEAAIRYVEMMGGVDAVVAKAQTQFDGTANLSATDGTQTYRWLAELLNHAVFADPDHAEAKALLAKVYDQLGYQAESAPWRDFYLTGAYELRHGGPDEGISPAVMKEVLLKTPVHLFFNSMAVNLNADKAADTELAIKVTFSDLDQSYLLTLKNSVLHHKAVAKDTIADATLTLTQPLFVDMIVGHAGIKDTLFGDDLTVDGSVLDLVKFFSLIEKPEGTFNIVTP